MKIYAVLFALFSFFIFSAGCKKDSGSESLNSSHGSTDSEGMSGICQQCHVSGGSGPGWFTIAGTVYNPSFTLYAANGTVYFYSGSNGTGSLLGTVEVDVNGNFYTTSNILPASGAYVQVKGASGDIEKMPSKVTSGSCNSCHGYAQKQIWVK